MYLGTFEFFHTCTLNDGSLDQQKYHKYLEMLRIYVNWGVFINYEDETVTL